MQYKIKHFKTLTSTNDYALELARHNGPEGLVITVDFQTHGRGRGKRRWISRRGENLLFSIIVRPSIKANRAPLLTQIAAASVKEILAARFPSTLTRIKKPNDVLMNGKKVCGILVESSTKNGTIDFAVIGIGLNVDSVISKRLKLATSIYEENKRKVSKNKLLKAILANFDEKYELFKNNRQYN